MSKKESERKVRRRGQSPNKARVDLRMEPELLDKIKTLASRANISVNQLMNGLAEWATRHAVVGEPELYEEQGEKLVGRREVAGCFFVGRLARIELEYCGPPCSLKERPIPEAAPHLYTRVIKDPGDVYGTFDHTQRRTVIDPWIPP